jgi:LacI family transcriptional regulator
VEGVPYLTIDNRAGVGLALQHLRDLGHRRIAYVGHGRTRHNTRERFEAYRDWMAERDLPTPDLDLLADQIPGHEDDTLTRCLSGPGRPTAILAFNDDLAVKVLEVARGMGLSLPGETLRGRHR